jgi:hypothetical protein
VSGGEPVGSCPSCHAWGALYAGVCPRMLRLRPAS